MIYFSDFGAGTPLGDVTVAVQDFQTGTATGVQNYTNSTITGVTPAAAMLFYNYHAVANDPGETQGHQFGATVLTASNGAWIQSLSRHNTASTDVQRNGDDQQLYKLAYMAQISNSEKQGDTSLISGGVSINYTSNSVGVAVNRRGAYIAFAGSDVSASANIRLLGTGTSALGITTGFWPDVVFFFGTGDNMSGSRSAFAGISIGVATKDGTQRCIMGGETNALAAGSPVLSLLTDSVGGQVSGPLDYKLVASGFNSTGFSLTPSSSAANDYIAYLALKLTNARVKIVDFTTPTSTGNASITGAGFTPRAAIVFLTTLEATNPTFPLTTAATMSGYSVSLIADNTWGVSQRAESAADPTSTASQITNALVGPSATDCDATKATLVSFDSDGMTLNYSAVQGTGKKGFILFIE